jgi:hypothetical protein
LDYLGNAITASVAVADGGDEVKSGGGAEGGLLGRNSLGNFKIPTQPQGEILASSTEREFFFLPHFPSDL